MKRYWSAQKPDGLSKAASREWDEFDAQLTPDDVIEMQIIDADCNDCVHFQRGPMVKHPGLTTFRGTCGKTGAPATAYPGQFSGHSCFEHRRRKTVDAAAVAA